MSNEDHKLEDRKAARATAEGEQAFKALAQGLADELLLERVDSSLGFIAFEIDGIDLFVSHGEDWGPRNVCLTCVFGPLPQERRVDVLHAALVANKDSFGPWSPMFSVEPETDHLLANVVLPLDGLTPDVLVPTLNNFALTATHWQRTYFLENEPA